jgi:ubiquinone/menaquinone biosynthesis C-methylase UbiE
MYDTYATEKARSYAVWRFTPNNFVGFRNYLREKVSFSRLDLSEGDTFLDIGCASGAQVMKAALICSSAKGIDIGRDFITTAQAWAENQQLENVLFEMAPAEKIPFEADSFSKILIMEMMDHVDDPSEVLREVSRVSKAGGRLVMSVPNMNHDGTIFGRLMRLIGRRQFAPLEHIHYDSASEHGNMHLREYRIKTLGVMLAEAGFIVDSITPVWHLDFPRVMWLLNKGNRFAWFRNLMIVSDYLAARTPGLKRFGGTLVVSATFNS